MDQLSDRAPALHRRRQVLDLVLARPQPPIPHLRPTRTVEPRRRPAQRDRPRPYLHLLGLTPSGRQPAASRPDSGGANSAVTVGPVWVDIARHALSDWRQWGWIILAAGRRERLHVGGHGNWIGWRITHDRVAVCPPMGGPPVKRAW